jgi:phosphoenolpyruvate-protein kinase (PTS system EI component)
MTEGMNDLYAGRTTVRLPVTSLQQEMAHMARTRMDHIETHRCRGLCDVAVYMQQLINDGQRWQETAKVSGPAPAGDLYDIGRRILAALVADERARHDVIRFALLVYETLSPAEVALLEEFERAEPARALAWVKRLLVTAGVSFEFTS